MSGSKPTPYPFRWQRDRLILLLWAGLLLLAVGVAVLSLTSAYRHVRTPPEPAAVGAEAGGRSPGESVEDPQRWQAVDLAWGCLSVPPALETGRADRAASSTGPSRVPPA
jgi:hypothetical protein